MYIIIYIKTVPKYFGVTVTPSTGSTLIRVYYCWTLQHTGINKDPIYAATLPSTTHRCILMDYFNNCNFSKQKLIRSLMMV